MYLVTLHHWQTQGGGCATCVKDGVYECTVIEVSNPRGDIKVLHFYNPCAKLSVQISNDIAEKYGVVILTPIMLHGEVSIQVQMEK